MILVNAYEFDAIYKRKLPLPNDKFITILGYECSNDERFDINMLNNDEYLGIEICKNVQIARVIYKDGARMKFNPRYKYSGYMNVHIMHNTSGRFLKTFADYMKYKSTTFKINFNTDAPFSIENEDFIEGVDNIIFNFKDRHCIIGYRIGKLFFIYRYTHIVVFNIINILANGFAFKLQRKDDAIFKLLLKSIVNVEYGDYEYEYNAQS